MPFSFHVGVSEKRYFYVVKMCMCSRVNEKETRVRKRKSIKFPISVALLKFVHKNTTTTMMWRHVNVINTHSLCISYTFTQNIDFSQAHRRNIHSNIPSIAPTTFFYINSVLYVLKWSKLINNNENNLYFILVH